MAKEKSPAYQRYPNDYLTDENVIAMTLEEEGCYNRLMDYCWKEGSLSTDIKKLAAMCKNVDPDRMRVIWKAIKGCFRPHPELAGRVVHPRLEKERTKQAEWSQKSRLGGLSSGASRARKAKRHKQSKGGSRVVQPKGNIASAFSFSDKENGEKKDRFTRSGGTEGIASIMPRIEVVNG